MSLSLSMKDYMWVIFIIYNNIYKLMGNGILPTWMPTFM